MIRVSLSDLFLFCQSREHTYTCKHDTCRVIVTEKPTHVTARRALFQVNAAILLALACQRKPRSSVAKASRMSLLQSSRNTSRVQVLHITTVLVTGKGSQMKTCSSTKTQKWPRSQELVRDYRANQVLHHGRKCKATIKETKSGRIKNCEMCPSGDLLPNLSWQCFPVGHAKDEVIRRVN